jgi:hypothetical protein
MADQLDGCKHKMDLGQTPNLVLTKGISEARGKELKIPTRGEGEVYESHSLH